MSKEQLSQGKGTGMPSYKHFFQKSLGIRRTGLCASTALPIIVILMIVQSVLPVYAANARPAPPSATLSSGCISPSDCVSKMTLPEKEGQMTQVEKNAFTQAGNSITDITTYFIGSVLSGGGGGPNGAGGTATQWADMGDKFQSFALPTRLGIQGTNGTLGPTNIRATAKHFIGDGHTAWGTGSPYLNEGDARISEQQLDTIDLPPYQSAVSNKVGSVMISYSSWNGLKDHANQYLITTKLKGTGTDSYGTPDLGFQGFVVSDWQAINQISSDYNYDVRTAINAGIDMIMVPDNYKTFISTLDTEIKAGNIPMSRIDDAVTRILTAKFASGLFTQPYTDRSYTPNVGSAAHRAVARQAERESLVLLKNSGVLPLSKTGSYTLVVGGDHANNLRYQLGGWSISWQGGSGTTTIGTTLWQAIQQAGLSSSVKLNFVGTRTKGNYRGDVGIVAVGETPYAEGNGDTNTLALSSTDATEVSDVCSRVTKR